jgi:NAD(P)-dependent dehydrogenase (short-subunit alcohol dehydrogenase family)
MMNIMKGKQDIITGPTSGIGKQIAIQLGAFGADIVLGCRDIVRGREVAKTLYNNSQSPSHIDVMPIDTSSIGSIRQFAQQYRATYSKLDVLINNAGVNRAEQPREESVDGIELTFATNVLGYYVLTKELIDMLKASAPSRIVNVASTFASDLDLDDLQFEHRPYDGMKAYAQSKACDRILTWAFARRLEKSGVTVNAMAPGLVPESNLFRRMSVETHRTLRQRGGVSVAQGADTAVWLASDPKIEGVNGRLFEQRKEIACHFRNIEDEEKFWDICRKMTGSSGIMSV